MRYELAILTHGRARTFEQAAESFAEQVHPAPTSIRVFADAVQDFRAIGKTLHRTFPSVATPALHGSHARQVGFCTATGHLWQACALRAAVDYVFWLEHDFLIERRVSIEQLASLLDQEEKLAQVVLVRNAVNEEEVGAGGLIQSRPDAFIPRHSIVSADEVNWRVAWLEHRAFYTTNPGLMRTDFMAQNPWPDDGEPACEGRFGLKLIEDGYRFAYWGDGIPWVRHVGRRDGIGY